MIKKTVSDRLQLISEHVAKTNDYLALLKDCIAQTTERTNDHDGRVDELEEESSDYGERIETIENQLDSIDAESLGEITDRIEVLEDLEIEDKLDDLDNSCKIHELKIENLFDRIRDMEEKYTSLDQHYSTNIIKLKDQIEQLEEIIFSSNEKTEKPIPSKAVKRIERDGRARKLPKKVREDAKRKIAVKKK